MQDPANRRETYIVGLFISKFDKIALKELECKTWKEAYTKISGSLGCKDTTIKNIRDWFDPFFNKRQGWHKNNPHKIVRDTLTQFGYYELEDLSIIVKNILFQYKYHNFNNIANLSTTEIRKLINIVEREKQQKQKQRNQQEKDYLFALLNQEGGDIEVPIFDCQSIYLVGIADLITHKEVIEIKNIKNWKHAVGQVYAYWYFLAVNNGLVINNLTPRVHLFGGNGINDYRFKLCQSLMEEIFRFYKVSTIVTSEKSNATQL